LVFVNSCLSPHLMHSYYSEHLWHLMISVKMNCYVICYLFVTVFVVVVVVVVVVVIVFSLYSLCEVWPLLFS
jgi:hypothetical protein